MTSKAVFAVPTTTPARQAGALLTALALLATLLGTLPAQPAAADPTPPDPLSTTPITAGEVSTMAGSAATASAAGTGAGATLQGPVSVAHLDGAVFTLTTDSKIMKTVISSGATTLLVESTNMWQYSCVFGTDTSTSRLHYGSGPLTTDGSFLYTLACGGIVKIDPSTGEMTRPLAVSGLTGLGGTPAGALYATDSSTIWAIDVAAGTKSSWLASPAVNSVRFYPESLSSDTNALWITAASQIYRLDLATKATAKLGAVSTGTIKVVSAGDYLYGPANDPANGAGTLVRRWSKADGSFVNIAGSAQGYQDGTGPRGLLNQVKDITASDTALYVADRSNNRIRTIIAGSASAPAQQLVTFPAPITHGTVSDLYGSGSATTAAGTATAAGFAAPTSAVVVGSALYTTTGDQKIVRTDLSTGASTVLTGGSTPYGTCTYAATGSAARFNSVPQQLVTDGTFLYAATCGGVVRIDPASGALSALALGWNAALTGLAVGPGGILYVATSSTIWTLDPSSGSRTSWLTNLVVSGTSVSFGELTSDTDSLWTVSGSQIYRIQAATAAATKVGAASAGTTQVMPAGDHLYGGANDASGGTRTLLRRWNKADGSFSNVAGSVVGHANGAGPDAALRGISGVLPLSSGALLVVDKDNNRIRQVVDATPSSANQQVFAMPAPIGVGSVSTPYGSGAGTSAAGNGTSAGIKEPTGTVVLGTSQFVSTTDHRIMKINRTTGAVTQLLGSANMYGSCTFSTTGAAAQFNTIPQHLTTDGMFVYAATCGGVVRINPDSGALSALSLWNTNLTGLTVGPNGVLYASDSYNIWTIDTNTGARTSWLTNPTVASSAFTLSGLHADETALWTTHNGQIHRIELTTKATSKLGVASPGTSWVVPAGDYLYGPAHDPANGSATLLRRWSKTDGTRFNVAGAAVGYQDGTGTEAFFNNISGLAYDGLGLLALDRNNHRVRLVAGGVPHAEGQDPSGNNTVELRPGHVSTFLGSGSSITSAGTGVAAGLQGPAAGTHMGSYSYIATGDSKIMKVDESSGASTQLIGGPTSTGSCVYTTSGTTSKLNYPAQFLTNDGTYLYAIACNGVVRINPTTGALSAVALGWNVNFTGLTTGPDGTLYVSDASNIWTLNKTNGDRTLWLSQPTVAGTALSLYGLRADQSSLWTTSSYNQIHRIELSNKAVSAFGTATPGLRWAAPVGDHLYGAVNDPANGSNTILRRWTKSDASIVNIAGAAADFQDGVGTEAFFNQISDVIPTGAPHIFVLDRNNNRVRKVTLGADLARFPPPAASQTTAIETGMVSTLVGRNSGTAASAAGSATSATISAPRATAVIGGYLYTAAGDAKLLRTSLVTGDTSVLIQGPTATGSCVYGPTGATARLGSSPSPLTTDGVYLYAVACTGIVRINPTTGGMSAVAANWNVSLNGLAVGPNGVLYASDYYNIWTINTNTGARATWTTNTAVGSSVSFYGIALDADAVWAVTNRSVYRIDLLTKAATLLGTASTTATLEIGAVTSAGAHLFTAEIIPGTNTSVRLRRWHKSTGAHAEIAGSSSGLAEGNGPEARFWDMRGMVSDGSTLYVADYGNNRIRKVGVGFPVAAGASFGVAHARAVSGGGNLSSENPICYCEDPINTADGTYFETLTDLSLPNRIPLTWNRTYATDLAADAGAMGHGWKAGYGAKLISATSTDPVRVVQENGSEVRFGLTEAGQYAAAPNVRATLSHDAGTGVWTFVRDHSLTLTFNSSGQLLSMSDRNDETLTFGYTSGRLATVRSEDDRGFNLTYDTLDRLVAVSDTAGRSISYGYNNSGDLASFTDIRGKSWSYAYDTNHRLTSKTNPLAQTVVNTYDAQGRVLTQTNELGGVASFSYSTGPTPNISITRHTNAAGEVQDLWYDKGWLVKKILAPTSTQPATWIYTLNAQGHVVQATDPLGNSTYATYDTAGNRLDATDATGRKTIWEYNALNLPTKEISPGGSVRTITYDSRGNLLTVSQELSPGTTSTLLHTFASAEHPGDATTVTDPTRSATQHEYNEAGLRTRSVSADGRITTNTYGPAGFATSTTSPRGNASGATAADYTKTFTHDPAGNLLSVVDGLGRTTTSTYDDAGRLVSTTNAAGGVSTNTRDAMGRVLISTAPDGRATTYAYDAVGRILSATAHDGGITSTTYDRFGRASTITTPAGNISGVSAGVKAAHTTTYVRDLLGNVLETQVPDPSGTGVLVEAATYDAAGRPLTSTDTTGAGAATADDLDGRPVSLTDPLMNTAELTYDLAGRVIESRTPLGHATTYGYDLAGRKISETNPVGATTTWAYNAEGLPLNIVEPRGNVTGANPAHYTTVFAHDLNRNPVSTTDALGNTTTAEYDRVGRPTTTTDARGNQTTYTYDALDRVASRTSADGGVFSYTYGPTGLLLSQTAPGNAVTTYDHDSAGRVISATDPLGNTRSWSYDIEGRLVAQVSAKGNATTDPDDGRTVFSYDALGRTLAVDHPGTTPDLSYEYDAAGRRTRMNDAAGQLDYSYDAAGRLTGLTRGATTFSYTYDADSRLTSRTYPGGATRTYTHDAAARPTSLVAAGGSGAGTTSFEYDPAGHLTTLTAPSGAKETYEYDRRGQVEALTHHKPDQSVLATRTYGRDAAGFPISMEVARGGATTQRSWNYDEMGRLQAECATASPCSPASGEYRYGYDLRGNRISEHTPTSSTTWTVNAADQLVSGTKVTGSTTQSVAYAYDADGQQTQSGDLTRTWNEAGQVLSTSVSAGTSGTTTTSYTYDGEGNRTSAQVGSATPTTYEWDLNAPLATLAREHTSSGEVRTFTSTPDGGLPLGMDVDGTGFAFQHDPLGSVLEVLDHTGARVSSRDYDPFGATRAPPVADLSGAPVNPIGFTGQYQDPSGEYNLRARQYDPALGAFTSRDPLGGSMDAFPGSLYTYSNANPLFYTDPSGMGPCAGASGTKPWDVRGTFCDTLSSANHVLLDPVRGAAADAGAAYYNTPGSTLERSLRAFDAGNPAARASRTIRGGVTAALEACTPEERLMGIAQAAGGVAEFGAQGLVGSGAVVGQGTKNLSPSATKVEADSAPERSMAGATCPSCFVAGTLVATETGLRPIEEIKPGEKVLAQNMDTGEKGLHEVTATVSHEDVAKTTLTVSSDDGTSEQLITTPNHPFWVEGRGWVEAGKLTSGDVLRSRTDGVHLRVLSVLTETVRIQVYNLTVADAHTFYVGTLEVLVHNTGSCPLPLPPYGTKGPKTSGVLQAPESAPRSLLSGEDGPALDLPKPRPGMNGKNMTHVEAHAAAIMRQEDLREATLWINRAPCAGTNGCGHLLPRMVPSGSRLTIHVMPEGSDSEILETIVIEGRG